MIKEALENASCAAVKDYRNEFLFCFIESCHTWQLGTGEKEFAEFHQRLAQFTGILDRVDEDTARSIVEMLPEVVVSPCWYDQEDIEGCESTDNVDRLHEALCDEFPALEGKHTTTLDDGFCKSITVAEFEG